MTILITGASGTVASETIHPLVAKGCTVRALVRSRAKARALAEAGAEVVEGDFADPASLDQAFAGVETVLSVTPPHAQASAFASASIEAAKRAGTKRIVRISAIKAAPDGPNDNSRQHARTDAEIEQSGLDYVILRPHFFMQNCLFGVAESIASGGVVRFAGGSAKLGMIDPRDISDVAVQALIDPRWDGGTYDLTGPASISFHDVARTLSDVLGRKVRYVSIRPEDAGDMVRRAGGNEWQIQATIGYFRAYSSGWGDFVTDCVPQISGHAARSFEDYAREVMVPALGQTLKAA
jgi:uncharacterized protein YbjT (DUF2867 family)